MIQIGASDEWTPAVACERLAEAQAKAGADLKLIVYPNAAHAFVEPELSDGKWPFGYWLKYDRDAAERAMAEMRGFLAVQLAN